MHLENLSSLVWSLAVIYGDVAQGLLVGATIQLMYMGGIEREATFRPIKRLCGMHRYSCCTD